MIYTMDELLKEIAFEEIKKIIRDKVQVVEHNKTVRIIIQTPNGYFDADCNVNHLDGVKEFVLRHFERNSSFTIRQNHNFYEFGMRWEQIEHKFKLKQLELPKDYSDDITFIKQNIAALHDKLTVLSEMISELQNRA